MALSVDQRIAKLLHKSLQIIDGEKDYQIIHDMWTVLYVNTPTLTTMLGVVNHGQISIVMQVTRYMKFSPTP